MTLFIKSSLLPVLLLTLVSCNQEYFEGEIKYDLEYIKKDSTFDLNNVGSYPAKTARSIVKNGSWIQLTDDGPLAYEFFDRQLNQQFFKLRKSDTLIYLDCDHIPSVLGPLKGVKTMKGTDTILGKVCDKIVLQTNK